MGERDWFADRPYYEFFSSPAKIRFEICPKKRLIDYFNKYWVSRYYGQFREVSIKLEDAGWTTFDLG